MFYSPNLVFLFFAIYSLLVILMAVSNRPVLSGKTPITLLGMIESDTYPWLMMVVLLSVGVFFCLRFLVLALLLINFTVLNLLIRQF